MIGESSIPRPDGTEGIFRRMASGVGKAISLEISLLYSLASFLTRFSKLCSLLTYGKLFWTQNHAVSGLKGCGLCVGRDRGVVDFATQASTSWVLIDLCYMFFFST